MGTADLGVFVQFLIEIWEIEKLEFQLPDALQLDHKLHKPVYLFCSAVDWAGF